VKRGLKADKEAFREFVNAWAIRDADRLIRYEDFYAYYSVIFLKLIFSSTFSP